MARRRSRRSLVKGKPNLMWIASAGDFALVENATVWDAVLIPGDWSGTVTEQQCTLLRMVISCYTLCANEAGNPHAQNAVVFMGDANEQGGTSTLDISSWNEWPDFFLNYDRILRIFRLEWDGALKNGNVTLPVQFSQLPEPVMNLKTPRVLKGDDTVRVGCGGAFHQVTTETYVVTWFVRALVRIGLR